MGKVTTLVSIGIAVSSLGTSIFAYQKCKRVAENTKCECQEILDTAKKVASEISIAKIEIKAKSDKAKRIADGVDRKILAATRETSYSVADAKKWAKMAQDEANKAILYKDQSDEQNNKG